LNGTERRDACSTGTPETGNDDWFGSGVANGVTP